MTSKILANIEESEYESGYFPHQTQTHVSLSLPIRSRQTDFTLSNECKKPKGKDK